MTGYTFPGPIEPIVPKTALSEQEKEAIKDMHEDNLMLSFAK